MPFYLRKSISAGPFRFNLSKSGVGLSVGVKGLRVGVGPRGHYIQAGRGGLYYRASLGRAGQRAQQSPPLSPAPMAPGPQPGPARYSEPNVEMIQVESGDVLAMRDARFEDVLKEINEKQAQITYASMFGASAGFLGLAVTFLVGQAGLIVLGLALPAWGIGRWLDSYKRRTVLFYNLEPDAAQAYEGLTRAFDQMAGCGGKWRIEAGGAVRDLSTWKRNAGASHIIDRKATSLAYSVPHGLATNITPPAVQMGKRTIYFFPDAAFIFHGKQVGAVGYDKLAIRWQTSNFIEEERVPHDAQVVSHTWKHPNKNGGPDRRFAKNYQIPICLYEAALFASESGLNEMLEFSRTGVLAPFVSAIALLGQKIGRPCDLLTKSI